MTSIASPASSAPAGAGARDAADDVEWQQRDDRSLLQLYRQLVALRRRHPCLQQGAYEPIRSVNDVLSYERVLGGVRMTIGLNVTPEPRRWDWRGEGRLVISTHLDREPQAIAGPTLLRPNEGLVVALD